MNKLNKSNTPLTPKISFQKVVVVVLWLSFLLLTGAWLMNLIRWCFQIDATPNTPLMLVITGVSTIILYPIIEIVQN